MKDHNNYIIEAINIYSERYPKYEISSIFIVTIDDNKVTYRINGIYGVSEMSDRITVDL